MEVERQLGSDQEDRIVAVATAEDKALGITWLLRSDELIIKYDAEWDGSTMTKRMILSHLMSIYDPLGIVAPFVLAMKLVMQRLTKNVEPVQWDEQVGEEIAADARKCFDNLRFLQNIRIPRCYVTPDMKKIISRTLHVFSDGSEYAYGSSGYLRQEDDSGHVTSRLVMGSWPKEEFIRLPQDCRSREAN